MTICYFTASGNCLYVARRIGGNLLSIPQLMRQETIEVEDNAVGIVCPCYNCEMPIVHIDGVTGSSPVATTEKSGRRSRSTHKDFMWNALTHTHGQNAYWRTSAENAYRVLHAYILKHHGLSELPEDINFYLKIYSFAAPYIYAEWAFNMENTPPEVFAEYVEGAMPEALKKYLLA